MEFSDLKGFLSQIIPKGSSQYRYTLQPIDSGGLYFNSDVHEVNVYLDNKQDKNPYLNLIVKLMKTKNKQDKALSKILFKKEAAFYQLAVPEYQQFLTAHHLEAQNLFPEFFNASDKIILLGNLRSMCYTGHKTSFDEAHTRLVIQELARFHATGVALKMSEPDIFQARLADVVTPALRNTYNPLREETNTKFRLEISALLRSMEGFQQFVESVDAVLKNIDSNPIPVPTEPFATLIHNDLWSGNILFSYSSNNEPNHVKFIDFQTSIYNSPARDLSFLLFTSVDEDVLKEFESIVLLYYTVFVDHLSKLKVNTEQFTLEGLTHEINRFGPTKLKHMILLFKTLSKSSETNYKNALKLRLQRLIVMFKIREWF